MTARGELQTGERVDGDGARLADSAVDGSFVVDVLPGTVLLGVGAGIAFNPALLAAMSDGAAGGGRRAHGHPDRIG